MQEGRLSSIVETEEQKLGVLVEQAKRRQDVVDCISSPPHTSVKNGLKGHGGPCVANERSIRGSCYSRKRERKRGNIHQFTIHMLNSLVAFPNALQVLVVVKGRWVGLGWIRGGSAWFGLEIVASEE